MQNEEEFLQTETNILSPQNASVVTLPVGVRSWHPMRLFTWLPLSLPLHGHIHYLNPQLPWEQTV